MAATDPLLELATFSVFKQVDLAQLAGEAKTVRGKQMRNPRFTSVESCWVAPGPPEQFMRALRGWDPARHEELNVYIHELGTEFARLRNVPEKPGVRALADATQARSSELQISKEEASRFSPAGPMQGPGAMPPIVGLFWKTVLTKRANAFASGGTAAQPPYDHTGQNIRPNEELKALLREQPKIRKQFESMLAQSGIATVVPGDPDYFWQLRAVGDKAVLTLGASYERISSATLQAADVYYYASGGFYVALTLYHAWPVELAGNPATLVWRGDLISSRERASGSSLVEHVSRTVRVLREDVASPP